MGHGREAKHAENVPFAECGQVHLMNSEPSRETGGWDRAGKSTIKRSEHPAPTQSRLPWLVIIGQVSTGRTKYGEPAGNCAAFVPVVREKSSTRPNCSCGERGKQLGCLGGGFPMLRTHAGSQRGDATCLSGDSAWKAVASILECLGIFAPRQRRRQRSTNPFSVGMPQHQTRSVARKKSLPQFVPSRDCLLPDRQPGSTEDGEGPHVFRRVVGRSVSASMGLGLVETKRNAFATDRRKWRTAACTDCRRREE